MKTHQVNGDASGPYVSASRDPLPGELERLSGPVVAADAPTHQPAFIAPQDNPATPRDEHHGKGGMYLMVDGKRVPANDKGEPLPPKSKK